MGFQLIPFAKEHAYELKDLSDEDARWRDNDFPTLTWRDRIHLQGLSGPAYSALLDGQVIACGGIGMHHPGVGEIWMVVTKGAGAAAVRLVRSIVIHLDNIAREWGFVRIQVTIPDGGLDFSRRLVTKMGFVRETGDCGMRKYAMDGSTCHLYGKVY